MSEGHPSASPCTMRNALVAGARSERRAAASWMRFRHQAASIATSGLRSRSLSEISEAGLQSAEPRGRPRGPETSTIPAAEFGRPSTSLLYIQGWPCSQRLAALADTTARDAVTMDGCREQVESARK